MVPCDVMSDVGANWFLVDLSGWQIIQRFMTAQKIIFYADSEKVLKLKQHRKKLHLMLLIYWACWEKDHLVEIDDGKEKAEQNIEGGSF